MGTVLSLRNSKPFVNESYEIMVFNKMSNKFPSGELILDVYFQNTFDRVAYINDCNGNKSPLSSITYLHYETRVESSDDIMELLLLKDAVDRECLRNNWQPRQVLHIPYLPYSRQDRVSRYGEPFSLKVIGNLINSMKFDEVITLDVHSDVAGGVIDNFTNKSAGEYINRHLEEMDEGYYDYVVAPDLGYSKKIHQFEHIFKPHNIRILQAYKMRDPETKKVLGAGISNFDTAKVGSRALILDDICEDGQTKVAVANALRKKGVRHVDVFVSHGIFVNGLEPLKPAVDDCYSTDSFTHPVEGLTRYEI